MFYNHTLQQEDVCLNYAVGPNHGPPLVLLHGVLRKWQDFAPLWPYLTPRWQMMALDFHGHGGSAPRPGKYCVADYVDDVQMFLREAVRQPVVLYGHSLGAMVAGAVAAMAPQSVRAVILEDPPFDTMGRSLTSSPLFSLFQGMRKAADTSQFLAQALREISNISISSAESAVSTTLGQQRDAASLRFSASCLRQVDPEAFEPILAGHWLDGYDRVGVMRAIRCPTLVLQADPEAGGMLTDADASEAEELISECVRVRFDNAGHLLHWTHTQEVAQVTLSFLESLRED